MIEVSYKLIEFEGPGFEWHDSETSAIKEGTRLVEEGDYTGHHWFGFRIEKWWCPDFSG